MELSQPRAFVAITKIGQLTAVLHDVWRLQEVPTAA
jgi:hypothetical protein